MGFVVAKELNSVWDHCRVLAKGNSDPVQIISGSESICLSQSCGQPPERLRVSISRK